MNSSDSGNKTARYLLWIYCLFIVYGCFIPFRFNFDPNFVRWRWAMFLAESLHERTARASLTDIVSNILLYVPFGIFSVWARMPTDRQRRTILSVFPTTVSGLLFGFVIECGQTLSPGRSPSMLDALCNGVGAFIGAAWGVVLIRGYREYLQNALIRVLCHQPLALLLAYILFGVLVDSYFPFDVTLDLSSIWHNLQRSQLLPFNTVADRYWFHLSIEKGIPYMALGYLFLINLRRFWRSASAGLTWLLTSALACALETAKLFFAGREFHSDNIIIASSGALLGIILLPRLCAIRSVKRHREAIWFMLVLGFLLYFELSPFEWVWLSELPARFSLIKWLPFKSYFYSEPVMALFDLQKKIYSLIPLGFITMTLTPVRAATVPRRKAALICFGVTATLELAQILVRSRIPSTSDLIIFNASAWAGIMLFQFASPIEPAKTSNEATSDRLRSRNTAVS